MQREEYLNEIEELFRDLLDDESLVVTEETSQENLEQWDSLFHMTLMATVGDELSIDFDTEDIVAVKDIKSLLDIIESKTK